MVERLNYDLQTKQKWKLLTLNYSLPLDIFQLSRKNHITFYPFLNESRFDISIIQVENVNQAAVSIDQIFLYEGN